MKSLLLVAALLPAFAVEVRAQEKLDGEPLRIRDLLQAFVDTNVASYKAETSRLSERLAGTVCEIGAGGLEPLALPEPSILDLSAIIPPRKSDVLRADEHIDVNSVRVIYGHGGGSRSQIAVDQETATVMEMHHGIPVQVTAFAFRVRDGECSLSRTRTTSNGARETVIQKKRFSVRTDRRPVDITDQLGRGLKISGAFSFDAQRNHLTVGQAGEFPLPTISGKGARFETVRCDGGDRQVLSGDDADLNIAYPSGSPKNTVEALGLKAVLLGTNAQREQRHLITGPGAQRDSLRLGLIANLIGNDREIFTRVGQRNAVEVALRRGPVALSGTGDTVTVGGTGEAGTAEIAVSPAGSTAGSLVDVLELTLNRARVSVPDRRPFADEPLVAELLVDGPLPAGSGLTVEWRTLVGQRQYAGGRLDAPAGGTELPLPVIAPPMDQILRTQGVNVTLEVEIRRGIDILFETTENILFRPPPVVGVDLVGRRDGVSGAFVSGPHDLFRIEDSAGVEIRLDVRFRDGSSRSYAPAVATAFGIQQSQGGGLLMAEGRQSAAIVRPRVLQDQGSAALRPFLRSSAADSSNLSPIPGTPLVQGGVSVFTLNDALLVIDNLGANGFVWRLLVEGEADMGRYTARYVTSDGDIDATFDKDGDGWIASRQFGATTAIRHVAIVDADGVEVARINQSQVRAITPRVSLEVPEIYRQGVSHPVTASIAGISGLTPFDLACQWSLEGGFGRIDFGSTRLTPIGDGFATCANAVQMDVNEATLGQFPTLDVRLVRVTGGKQ
ncbi:MAG: hypothetical protein P1U37_16430 [Minwuia sp.]|nr:hypothetical protein [Minwuia sp.]